MAAKQSAAAPPTTPRIRWYQLHTTSGAVLALLLYTLFVTGCLMVFLDDLHNWQYPELRTMPTAGSGATGSEARDAAPAAEAIAFPAMLQQARQAELIDQQATFYFPPHSSAVILRARDRIGVFEPTTGALLAVRQEGALRFIRDLHADLLLPVPLGLFVVGLIGVSLLLMVISGFVVHRRFYRELLTWRPRPWRLAWSDAHKLAGIWGGLFYLLMGFSGSILSLISLFLMVTASATYPDGYKGIDRVFKGPVTEASGEIAAIPDLNAILAHSRTQAPMMDVDFITVKHIGDANSQVIVEGTRPGHLSALTRKVYNREGTPVYVFDDADDTAPGVRTYVSLMALHFADFGGVGVRWLYLLLGLSAALMPVSGMLLWGYKRERPKGFTQPSRLTRFCVSWALAVPAVIAACLAADRLGFDRQSALFGVFCLVMIAFGGLALLCQQLRRQVVMGLYGLGLLWLFAAVSDLALFGYSGMDIVFLVIGVGFTGAGVLIWRQGQSVVGLVNSPVHTSASGSDGERPLPVR